MDEREVDHTQPWQTQYAERLSRSINSGSPAARRQVRVFFLWMLALVMVLVLCFGVTVLLHAL